MEFSRLGQLLPDRIRPLARRSLVRYRFIGLHRHDAMLVSYPKSGSTWLRFLLTQVLTGSEANFDSIRDTMPPIGRHRRAPAVLPDGGRLVRTHEPLSPYRGSPGQPVLHLVRNAQDVCVSYFNHVRRQGFDGDLATFVERFLDGRVDGYGTWSQHVLASIAFERDSEAPFLDLRYEHLRADTVAHLATILAFLGVEPDEAVLREVVESNSRERMRSKEADSVFLRRRMGGPAPVPEEQRWEELVPSALRERFDRECRPGLVAAGYASVPLADAD